MQTPGRARDIMTVLRWVLPLLLLSLSACQTSQVVMNTPLERDAAGAPIYKPGYTLQATLQSTLKAPEQVSRGDVLLALSFSGGGKRSAAFAYGALKGLRAMPIIDAGQTKRLLDDVDYIAAVSGGSFPAVHYGLYREDSFKTFDADFLRRDINAFIWGIYLLPWNWEWLINPLFGTNDAMAQVYDRLLFHGATYADLEKQGSPMISVNATDLAGGSAFAFNQTSFDLLCSDLSTFPVSRAVAASAAFPILFTPITLTSYRRDCIGHPPPGAPGMALLREGAPLSRATALARDAARKMDPDRTQYVHLMDGGIADNLALRTLSNALVALDSDAAELRRLARVTRRIVVISVDGQAVVDPDIGQRRVVSGFGQIISAVSGSQIDAYSFETLLLLDTQVKDLTQKFRELRCAEAPMINGYPCDDVQGGLVQVSLRNVADPELRRRLQAVATSFTIPDADVDALVDQGSELIRTNPQLRDLLSEFLVKPQVVAAAAGPRQSDH